ncbi:MAG: hypothetical protein HZA93_07650 [Verrucomicrobia bacterium]|nr:hypothetical protein [Verrucomicrobiota bacterium]
MLSRRSPALPSNVLSHWYAVVDGVQFSAQDFYESILDELAARKLPQLNSSHVEYHEGGVLSDKRVYLRLARERFAFDICAAPFGTGYFFSVRFVEKPRSWLRFFVFLVLAVVLWNVAWRAYYTAQANFWWVVGLTALGAAGYWIVKQQRENANPASKPVDATAPFPVEMPDFDRFFLNTAVIGDLYERTRKNTYYRHDTRLLYHAIVFDLVKKKVDEFTADHGVKLLRTYDYNPILGELYKPAKVKPGAEDDAE